MNTNLLPCTCEGVHEGRQRPVEHLKERVSARILFRSTQHCMLKDVWNSCAIHGSRPELDTEKHQTLYIQDISLLLCFNFIKCSFTNLFTLGLLCGKGETNLKRLLESSLAACRYWAPVLSCVNFTAVRNKSGTATTWETEPLVRLTTYVTAVEPFINNHWSNKTWINNQNDATTNKNKLRY